MEEETKQQGSPSHGSPPVPQFMVRGWGSRRLERKPIPLKLRLLILALFCLLIILVVLGTGYRNVRYSPHSSMIEKVWQKRYEHLAKEGTNLSKSISDLKDSNRRLEKAFERYVPKSEYIVIDSVNNRLYLRKNGKDLLDAVCSAGSGAILADTPSGRRWVFDTPKGEFNVLNKTENPVWKKPDWAFIEEGKPIPKNYSERFEYGMLGEYGIYFSTDGYLIHGTLYERLLGRSITHGCIRLGRDDLRVLYRSTHIGTKVYAF